MVKKEELQKLNDKDYRTVAEVRQAQIAELAQSTRRAQFEYGRWLFATLILVHGGAFIGIAGVDGLEKSMLLAGGKYFIAGIALALFAGLSTWMNFNYSMKIYYDASHPIMLLDAEHYPETTKYPEVWKVQATYWISICLGCLSAIMLVCGAIAVLSAL